MYTSAQGAARLGSRHVPNREFGFYVAPDRKWCLRTAGVTVDQRWKFPIAVVVIVILTTLATHSHLTLSTHVNASAVKSHPTVVTPDDFTTSSAPAAGHRPDSAGGRGVRDSQRIQKLRSP